MREFKCKGCYTYEDSKINTDPNFAVCNHIPFVKDHHCPCQSCMVKPMCIDPCEDYTTYIQWLIKYYPHMLNESKISMFRRWVTNDRQ